MNLNSFRWILKKSGKMDRQFQVDFKLYRDYQILPYNKKLLKIDPKRPENNYFNYSNIVFKKK